MKSLPLTGWKPYRQHEQLIDTLFCVLYAFLQKNELEKKSYEEKS